MIIPGLCVGGGGWGGGVYLSKVLSNRQALLQAI